ncbi:Uncharacterised protein [Mycobacteroides abscessus subsp. massiliense]|nr:Uncharacterised protein [Mycobacteroides abscessus subsp. massiliense]
MRVAALDVLHRDPQVTLRCFSAVVHRDDIGVVQGCGERCLAHKPCPELGVA